MILERPQLDRLATYLSFHAQFDEVAFQWEYIDQISRRFKRQLRPLLRHVEWMAWSGQQPFLWAVHCLKQIFEKKRSLTSAPLEDIPTDFIPDSLKQYLYTTPSQTSKKLLVDRYEFLVYRVLRDGIEAGHLFCRDSVRYRSLEDDLVDPVRWQSKESLLVQAGLSALTAPIEVHLMALEQNLEERLTDINQHIISGQNQHFQFKKRGQPRWTLSQPHDDERLNHSFFDPFPQVDLNTLLHFTHQHCHFMNVFEHILRRYRKTETDERVLTACLIAWGTNMGLGRMGAISDIPYPALATASHLFIRLETLQIANDLISNAIAKLPIFHHYDLGNTLHSSSDGQRFETRLSTFNARYSSKYFGLKKGVIAYTLVANHIPIHAHLISADEHESHYVFDILSSNTTDLHPTIHSTDTHGTNEVNFAILSCFGYHFAPRYRDIYDKVTHSLYGFQHPSAYDPAWPLRPLRKVNTALIVDQWDHIQRIMLSLALKTTTQSIIVRKLSSHARRNKTQQALWEYDHILRSLYLLDYIDSLSLRRHVQSALNRGENYHQLRRAVSYANFGRLRFKTEAEQHLWLECSRLITNCIIFYNASLLSNVLRFKEEQADPQHIAQLKHVSPIAWQHINFYGRYSFATQPPLIDVSSLVQPLANLTIEPYPID